MNRQEYTEQMKDLCRKQAELKIAHMDNLEDLEAKTARLVADINENARVLVADINENARVEKRQMKANYLREQLVLECQKQQLRADYLMEHPEEAKNEN